VEANVIVVVETLLEDPPDPAAEDRDVGAGTNL
jgi:hypothetical protein